MAVDADVVVVGGGIIGRTVAKVLEMQGRSVVLLDDRRQLAGTAPSGGHLKPSWFGGLKKSEYEPAMEILAAAWDLKKSAFRVWPTPVYATVYRVNTDLVLQYPAVADTAVELHELDTSRPVVYTMLAEYRCRLLLVATGVWAADLVPGIKVQAKRGVSFRFRGRLEEPFVRPWSPYKQIVAHQQGPYEVWAGDGTAIIQENWTEDRTKACLTRCRGALGKGLWPVTKQLHGLRPYCDVAGNEPCLLRSLGPAAWLATGAGKSGTIAAGWVARRMLDATS